MDIKRIKWNDIPGDLISLALKEGVTVPNTERSYLFAAYNDDAIIGFVGLVTYKGKSYGLMKSAYVHPEHRRSGVYKKLNDYRLGFAKSIGLQTLITSAYFDAANLHLANGGKILKRYQEGLKIELCIK